MPTATPTSLQHRPNHITNAINDIINFETTPISVGTAAGRSYHRASRTERSRVSHLAGNEHANPCQVGHRAKKDRVVQQAVNEK
jgi:hypothetical protein